MNTDEKHITKTQADALMVLGIKYGVTWKARRYTEDVPVVSGRIVRAFRMFRSRIKASEARVIEMAFWALSVHGDKLFEIGDDVVDRMAKKTITRMMTPGDVADELRSNLDHDFIATSGNLSSCSLAEKL